MPAFKAYFATVADMDAEQRAFYRSFVARYLAGEQVDLDGQWSYGFVWLHSLARAHDVDPTLLRANLARVEVDYADTPLANYANEWLADTHFLDGDMQSGWNVLRRDGAGYRLMCT